MISKPAKQLIFDIALIRGEELFHNLDYFHEKEYQYAESDKKELNLFCCLNCMISEISPMYISSFQKTVNRNDCSIKMPFILISFTACPNPVQS